MQVEIITPDKNLYEGEATSVLVPASDGELGIFNNHAPLICSLKAGKVKVSNNGQDQLFDVNGGVVEVLKNKVIVLAE